MHIFHDPTLNIWRFHPGELPEKRYVTKPGDFLDEKDIAIYDKKIAAIKQNALTVGNPEIIPIVGGEFYEWPGGYERKFQTKKGDTFLVSESISGDGVVAILTLPEEKKNTMENNYERELEIYLTEGINYGANTIKNADPEDLKQLASDSFHRGWTASDSVAAPKEEHHENWYKIITEVLQPNKHPMCRDCADENGTCPSNNGLPCDPTDEVIERFKRLKSELASLCQQLKEREEVIKELLPIAEEHTNHNRVYGKVFPESLAISLVHQTIIDRAKALLIPQQYTPDE